MIKGSLSSQVCLLFGVHLINKVDVDMCFIVKHQVREGFSHEQCVAVVDTDGIGRILVTFIVQNTLAPRLATPAWCLRIDYCDTVGGIRKWHMPNQDLCGGFILTPLLSNLVRR